MGTGAAGGVGVETAFVFGVVGVWFVCGAAGACFVVVGVLRFGGVLRLVVWARVIDEMAKTVSSENANSEQTRDDILVVGNTVDLMRRKNKERVIEDSWSVNNQRALIIKGYLSERKLSERKYSIGAACEQRQCEYRVYRRRI